MSATPNTFYNQLQGTLATMKAAVLDGDSYAATDLGVYPIEYGDGDEGFYGTVAFTMPFINDTCVVLEGGTYGEMTGLRFFRPVPMNENEIKKALCLAMKDGAGVGRRHKGPLLDSWKIVRSEDHEGNEAVSWTVIHDRSSLDFPGYTHDSSALHRLPGEQTFTNVAVVRWIMRNDLWPRS